MWSIGVIVVILTANGDLMPIATIKALPARMEFIAQPSSPTVRAVHEDIPPLASTPLSF